MQPLLLHSFEWCRIYILKPFVCWIPLVFLKLSLSFLDLQAVLVFKESSGSENPSKINGHFFIDFAGAVELWKCRDDPATYLSHIRTRIPWSGRKPVQELLTQVLFDISTTFTLMLMKLWTAHKWLNCMCSYRIVTYQSIIIFHLITVLGRWQVMISAPDSLRIFCYPVAAILILGAGTLLNDAHCGWPLGVVTI